MARHGFDRSRRAATSSASPAQRCSSAALPTNCMGAGTANAQDRDDRRGPRRRRARHPVRQGRASGDVLVTASRAAEGARREGRPERQGRHGRRGGRVRRCRAAGRALYGGRADRQGIRQGARRENSSSSMSAIRSRAATARISSSRSTNRAAPGWSPQSCCPGRKLVRGFNAIGFGKLDDLGQRKGDARSACRSPATTRPRSRSPASLIREIGFEPVVVGGLAMGKYLVPGTPLAGEHTPAEIRQIAATLK